MRLSLFTYCIAILLFSSFSFEKPDTAEIMVTGLRIDKERSEALKKITKQSAFTFDKDGILRATKNYQIIYVEGDKILIILPKKITYSDFKKIDGYEDIHLGNGAWVACMCEDLGANYDNCRFDNFKNKEGFVCTGSCGCFIAVIFPKNNTPIEYETAGGGWFNF